MIKTFLSLSLSTLVTYASLGQVSHTYKKIEDRFVQKEIVLNSNTIVKAVKIVREIPTPQIDISWVEEDDIRIAEVEKKIIESSKEKKRSEKRKIAISKINKKESKQFSYELSLNDNISDKLFDSKNKIELSNMDILVANLSFLTPSENMDVVVQKQSAVEETAELAATSSRQTPSNEVVEDDSKSTEKEDSEIDSNNTKTVNNVLADRPISTTVTAAIQRGLDSIQNVRPTLINKHPTEFTKAEEKEDEFLAFDYSKQEEAPTQTKAPTRETPKDQEGFLDDQAEKSVAKTTIRLFVKDKLSGQLEQVKNFDLVSENDLTETISDANKGEIQFERRINNDTQIERFKINSKDSAPQRFEIATHEGKNEYSIPIFSAEDFSQSYNFDFDSRTGVALVRVTDSAEYDLDVEFASKYFLDENLNSIDKGKNPDQEATFVMFTGVRPGNALLLAGANKEIAERLIFIAPGEINFYESDLSSNKGIANILETPIMGSKSKLTELDETEIYGLVKNTKINKVAPGVFEYSKRLTDLSSRTYFNIKNGRNNYYVGFNRLKDNEIDLEIPSFQYTENVVRNLDIEDLNQQCVVQMNFRKEIKDIKIEAEGVSGPMQVYKKFIDDVGDFFDGIDNGTQKGFISTEDNGILFGKVIYQDDSQDSFVTYCAKGSYVVEQF